MKKNNKGFSLVELIIVIAIMAILAGAIAPALIRYIDKSRRSNDVTASKTIKTAIETALGNESVYEYLTTGSGDYSYVIIKPGVSTSYSSTTLGGDLDTYPVLISQTTEVTEINGKSIDEIKDAAAKSIGESIGEKTPKLKYKKNAADKTSDRIPQAFVGVISKKGTVYVYIALGESLPDSFTVPVTTGENPEPKSDKDTGFMICPTICDEYQ